MPDAMRCGRNRLDECMIVEDADAGIEADKRAGMKTVSVM